MQSAIQIIWWLSPNYATGVVLINFGYFSVLTLLASLWPLPANAKKNALQFGVIGLLLTCALIFSNGLIRNWMPAPLLAVAYWQSGCFFQQPNFHLQQIFESLERQILRVLHLDPRKIGQTWIGSLLELAYVFCYPVVPLGLAALYLSGHGVHAAEYWKVVLLSTYPCYFLLLFLPLLPPRRVDQVDCVADRRIRRFNLWLVRRVTHEANTFPSGHVASATAIALVLLRYSPGWGLVFTVIAIGIAGGCMAGRYHYVLDVAAAFLLASVMFAWTLG